MEYKPWKDLTDEEKGALLLAQHEGRVIEVLLSDWRIDRCFDPKIYPDYAYRISPPEPVVVEEVIYYCPTNGFSFTPAPYMVVVKTVDGEPKCDLVEMRKF